MDNCIDLRDRKITVIRFVSSYVSPKGEKKKRVLYKCECGNEKECNLSDIKSGKIVSCGCFKIKQLVEKSIKHGMKGTRPYRVWQGMLSRCKNSKTEGYRYYGGRGIRVCDKWETFEGFWLDMKQGYDDLLSIDRVDNNGSYCKENCRWATRKRQANNMSNNKHLTYKGATKNLKQWSEFLGIKYSTFHGRVSRGKMPLDNIFSSNLLINPKCK